MKHFLQVCIDFFRFPFQSRKEPNRFREIINFMAVEYPAYLRNKPSIWRVLLFPFLLITKLFTDWSEWPWTNTKKPQE